MMVTCGADFVGRHVGNGDEARTINPCFFPASVQDASHILGLIVSPEDENLYLELPVGGLEVLLGGLDLQVLVGEAEGG